MSSEPNEYRNEEKPEKEYVVSEVTIDWLKVRECLIYFEDLYRNLLDSIRNELMSLKCLTYTVNCLVTDRKHLCKLCDGYLDETEEKLKMEMNEYNEMVKQYEKKWIQISSKIEQGGYCGALQEYRKLMYSGVIVDQICDEKLKYTSNELSQLSNEVHLSVNEIRESSKEIKDSSERITLMNTLKERHDVLHWGFKTLTSEYLKMKKNLEEDVKFYEHLESKLSYFNKRVDIFVGTRHDEKKKLEEMILFKEFKLLNLPFVARGHILKNFDFFDLINLSKCSKRSKSATVESVFTNSTKMDIKYQNTSENPSKKEFYIHLNCRKANLKIYIVNDGYGIPESDLVIRKFFDKNYYVKIVENDNRIFIKTSSEVSSHAVSFTSEILNHFKLKLKSIEVDLQLFTSASNLRDFLHWDKLKTLDHLLLKNEKLADRDCKLVLGEFKDIKKLTLNCGFDDEMVFTNHVYIEILHIHEAKWLSIDKLRRFHCSEIVLDVQKISFLRVQIFIRNWINGRNRRLKALLIKSYEFENLDFEEVAYSYIHLTKKWDPKRRGPVFQTSKQQIDCRNGLDIERDGVLATICFEATSFSFVVWHDPFPVIYNN